MIDQEHYDHQRFSGARTLLEHADLRPGVVPTDLAGRKALLEPMVRAAWDCEQRGGRSLEEVAAELYAAADLMESGDDAPLRGITGTPEVLRAIAEHVAIWRSTQREADPVRTSGELAVRFPALTDMLVVYYGQDGIAVEEYPDDPRRSLQVVVDDWHPWCASYMPPLAAQCQEALTLFQTEEALEQFFTADHGGDSCGLPWLEWLPLVIDVVTEHLRAHHPLRWQPARPR
ncbi:hypothetical protein [Actinacidiphila bryophytorum]|uniref:hypothetical protein n=1 Tax=Actinacidiphila bryophytorum TaxID=1436133 RepID=UPI002176B7DD|nr:hypothetical protein [Actinacidiphila bryophytorum]UWE13263.1 hypothetical protein NYE86_34395 [Actinacidiphila bryophytorum]